MHDRLDPIAEQLRARIAANLAIEPGRLRWINAKTPGQFGDTGWRWEIFYGDQWRELPWHFDGPLHVTRELVRWWYAAPKRIRMSNCKKDKEA